MVFDSKTRVFGSINRPRENLVTHLLRRMIAQIEFGHITVVLPSSDRVEHFGKRPGASAELVVHRWRAIRRLVSHGDLGFAEAYIDGDWSSPDLVGLLELAAQNIAVLDRGMAGFQIVRMANRVRHLLRTNSKSGSRRNVSFHYDLGNAFYECWLDQSMTYSSALYTNPDMTLAEAQDAKLSRIVELLDLRGGETVLEIGCGWGALAVRLAQSAAQVTGVTLSSEQLAFAQERVEREDLNDRIALKLADYRDVDGSYDRIVSIEMLEAVGEAYWPVYFKTLHERLRTGGIAVLQVITIDEARFPAYRRSADFIQRHIFPGGMLPTREMIAEQAKAANLKPVSAQMFGQDYAKTLAEWRKRFIASWPQIEAMGFPKRFHRLWEYYLCYCEAGFRKGTIDVGFYVLAKG
ncbi:SAM-dependent methyltransferase [Chelatococcus asaccharovorans]|uniref:SAM-dependent methyltransferase n=1 Tax=Chelatococcus asaccharovorans TaxID=28210 RepID=UPI00224C6631|nr:cyclopropane-fatty-acyl-phospholipid synthase family protein [Chelatococcus asaccharovorans]CAH1669549.1 Cyclopropane-fatty-acyl-phospholipid synthase [Chelatococcus asaccharovorans]CAH1679016.1 Cyclopropane-fatty-acyl-phospholipid synthase [Chelatococcus asaccharovorans]